MYISNTCHDMLLQLVERAS